MRILVYESELFINNIRYPHKQVLENLNHSVDVFDWKQFLPTYINTSNINKVKEKFFIKKYIDEINQRLQKVIRLGKYDLLLVIMGKYLYPDTINLAKQNIKHVVNWNTDEPFNLLNSSEWLIKSLPLYDAHFTPRIHLSDEYKEYGMKNIFELDWYYRYGTKPIKIQNKIYKSDVNFIGAWSNRREDFIKAVDCNISLYGWGWNKKAYIKNNYNIHDHISILEMLSIFSTTKININLLTTENRDSSNLRNFEIPASHAFQLSERSEKIKELFKEDEEIVLFTTHEEMVDKYKYYLKNEILREKIAHNGYLRLVNNDYSLENRINLILNKLENLS